MYVTDRKVGMSVTRCQSDTSEKFHSTRNGLRTVNIWYLNISFVLRRVMNAIENTTRRFYVRSIRFSRGLQSENFVNYTLSEEWTTF